MSGALLITADRSLGAMMAAAMAGSGVDLTIAEDRDAATRALVTARFAAVVADAARQGDVSAAGDVMARTGTDVPLAVIAGEGARWNPWSLAGATPERVFTRPLAVREVRDALQRMVHGGAGERLTELAPGVMLDGGSDAVQRDGRRVALTRIETRILQALAGADGAIVATEDLLRRVWVTDLRSTDSLRTHIRNLRVKLEALGCGELVENVARRGYRLRAELA